VARVAKIVAFFVGFFSYHLTGLIIIISPAVAAVAIFGETSVSQAKWYLQLWPFMKVVTGYKWDYTF